MNENLKPVEKLTPFTKMIMTIGTLPSSFYASMSYYESMVWLYEYLKNEIIPAVNNNGEAVEELQELYVQLKEWCETYVAETLPNEVNRKLDEMVEDGTFTQLLTNYIKSGYVSNYGGKDNENITSIINSMINDYHLNYIYCDVNGIIDTITILNNQKITFDFLNHTIQFQNKHTETSMFTNNGSLNLFNGVFTGNNTNSMTILRGENNSYNIINNCKFINFKENEGDRQTHVINLYCGSISKITNCHFENILQKINAISTDYGGTASCILCHNYDIDPTSNETSLIINSCSFKNNWNIDENDDPIIEDYDNIKFQNNLITDNTIQTNDNFVVSNITSYNSGKRVIKAQTNNVSINNVSCDCNNFKTSSIITSFFNNHNISNIYGKLYQAGKGIEILNGENINIDNINIINLSENTDNIFNAGIHIQKGQNININNVLSKGFSLGAVIWDNSKDINFNNSKFKSYARSLYIYTRTTENANPSSGINIDNIKFNNCIFETDGESTNRLYEIATNNSTNTINSINFDNCVFKASKTTYLYGTFLNDANESILSNCKFNFTNSSAIQVLSTAKTLKLINCKIETTDNTTKIRFRDNARGYIDKLITNANLDIQGTSKLIVQYSSYTAISGNTEQNCHIDSFDMS